MKMPRYVVKIEVPSLKLWLSFARDEVSTFQTCISSIEKDNISATEVAVNIENLVNNLESRKSEVFVTIDVKKQMKMLVDLGESNEAKFFEVVENFYETSFEYVNK
jgi:prefoldin subunit 5